MNKEIKNAVIATDKKSQYDEGAKRLLGEKNILAYILVKVVDEFKDMNPRDVVRLIEGDPYIGVIPIEPGLTNKQQSGQRIVGFNTESGEQTEGLVRFDIVCYVRMKDGISQIIINVEAQKDEPAGYNIVNRAIFYVSRLISSQKERDFENTNYDDIKRVYSIWVCMNMETNNLSHIHLVKDDLVGLYEWGGKLELFNIIMIGLSKELPESDEMYELHRLLGALFSQKLTIDERLNLIGAEYNIPIEDKIRKDVSVMCNLSQGIEEAGIAKGRAEGIEQGRKQGREEGREEGIAEGREEGREEGIAEGIAEGIIGTGYEVGCSQEEILNMLQKRMNISLQKAQEYLENFSRYKL